MFSNPLIISHILKNDIKREKEELQRQKAALQKQIDFYQVRGYQQQMSETSAARSPSLSPHMTPSGSSSDLRMSTPPSDSRNSTGSDMEVSHRRSHSAELIDMQNPQLSMFVDSKYSASLTEPLNMKEARAAHLGGGGQHSTSPDRQSRGSLSGSGSNLSKTDRSSSQGSLKKLASNNNTVQQIPSKLVSSTSVPAKQSKQNAKSMIPINLAESSKKVAKDQTPTKPSAVNKKGEVIYF